MFTEDWKTPPTSLFTQYFSYWSPTNIRSKKTNAYDRDYSKKPGHCDRKKKPKKQTQPTKKKSYMLD